MVFAISSKSEMDILPPRKATHMVKNVQDKWSKVQVVTLKSTQKASGKYCAKQ